MCRPCGFIRLKPNQMGETMESKKAPKRVLFELRLSRHSAAAHFAVGAVVDAARFHLLLVSHLLC